MKAFFTGSRVYGSPRPDSDYDLVIRADYDELFEDLAITSSNGSGKDSGDSLSIKIGKLNIIVCLTDRAYEGWLEGTKLLKVEVEGAVDSVLPTRDRAVEVIREALTARGVKKQVAS